MAEELVRLAEGVVRLVEGVVRLAGEAAKCLVLVEAEVSRLAEVVVGKVDKQMADMKQLDWQGEDKVVEGEKRGRSGPGRGPSR